MKKIILSCAAALLAIGSACATPKFLSLNNKHGKTTIKIEIPASDRDETNGLSIEDVVLYNDGKTFQAKKVDAIWGDNSIVILQFEKLTAFEDCTLSFSVNGKPVWIFRVAWPIANKICLSWSGLVASVPVLWECRVYIWGSCLSDVPLANDRGIELICGLCRFCNADTPFLSKEGKGVSASNSSPKTYNRVLLFVAGRSNVRSGRCDFS